MFKKTSTCVRLYAACGKVYRIILGLAYSDSFRLTQMPFAGAYQLNIGNTRL